MAITRQRRYSVEFKLQLVRAYLSGEGSLKGIAGQHGINHSLLIYDGHRRKRTRHRAAHHRRAADHGSRTADGQCPPAPTTELLAVAPRGELRAERPSLDQEVPGGRADGRRSPC